MNNPVYIYIYIYIYVYTHTVIKYSDKKTTRNEISPVTFTKHNNALQITDIPQNSNLQKYVMTL